MFLINQLIILQKKSETLQKLNMIRGLLHSRVFLTLFTIKQKRPTDKFNEI